MIRASKSLPPRLRRSRGQLLSITKRELSETRQEQCSCRPPGAVARLPCDCAWVVPETAHRSVQWRSLHRCILVLPSFSPLATSSARPRHHSGVSQMISQLCFSPSGRVVLPTAQNSLPSGRPQANMSPFHSLSCFHISNFPP